MFDLTYIMVGLQTREVQPLISLITGGVIDTTTLAMVKTIPHSTLAFLLVRLPGLEENVCTYFHSSYQYRIFDIFNISCDKGLIWAVNMWKNG